MLSDKDLLAVLNAGELKIEPRLPDLLRPVGLTLHLGAEIAVPAPGIVEISDFLRGTV